MLSLFSLEMRGLQHGPNISLPVPTKRLPTRWSQAIHTCTAEEQKTTVINWHYEVMIQHKEEKLLRGSELLGLIIQRGCGISFLGGFPDRIGQTPKQHSLNSVLTLLWPRGWVTDLLRFLPIWRLLWFSIITSITKSNRKLNFQFKPKYILVHTSQAFQERDRVSPPFDKAQMRFLWAQTTILITLPEEI